MIKIRLMQAMVVVFAASVLGSMSVSVRTVGGQTGEGGLTPPATGQSETGGGTGEGAAGESGATEGEETAAGDEGPQPAESTGGGGGGAPAPSGGGGKKGGCCG